jgi:N-methylhydantoinase A
VYWKGRATALLPKPTLRRLTPNGSAPAADRHRRAWFQRDEATDAPVYPSASLAAGARVEGPAMVEEPTTTIVVHPRWVLSVGSTGDYLLERSGDAP